MILLVPFGAGAAAMFAVQHGTAGTNSVPPASLHFYASTDGFKQSTRVTILVVGDSALLGRVENATQTWGSALAAWNETHSQYSVSYDFVIETTPAIFPQIVVEYGTQSEIGACCDGLTQQGHFATQSGSGWITQILVLRNDPLLPNAVMAHEMGHTLGIAYVNASDLMNAYTTWTYPSSLDCYALWAIGHGVTGNITLPAGVPFYYLDEAA
jgi:hypothetical protein